MNPLLLAALPLLAPPPATVESEAVVSIAAPAAPAVRNPAAVVWRADLNAAFAESKRTGKPVLIVFGATWCHYCHKQDDETLTDAGVRAELVGFVPVRLDYDAHQKAAEILEVKTLPQAVILSPTADLLGRAAGFHNPSQFTGVLTGATAKYAGLTAAKAARVAAGPTDSATL